VVRREHAKAPNVGWLREVDFHLRKLALADGDQVKAQDYLRQSGYKVSISPLSSSHHFPKTRCQATLLRRSRSRKLFRAGSMRCRDSGQRVSGRPAFLSDNRLFRVNQRGRKYPLHAGKGLFTRVCAVLRADSPCVHSHIRDLGNSPHIQFAARICAGYTDASETSTFIFRCVHCHECVHWVTSKGLEFCFAGNVERCTKKQMPFMEGESDCPPALSRAPGCGVHRSEAKTLHSGRNQAQGLAGKGRFTFDGESRKERVRSTHEKVERLIIS